ncbi:retrovirus-related pol polyprotein from transposon TNT 1-94 [Tanacetum coccineum]
MSENLKLLINFVWKFMGTVRFGNDHVAIILGYGDIQRGNILITWVYFIEGLGHNLFSIGQFCDSDLEVAFRRNTCFVRNLDGVDLLKGNCSTNLYTINLYEMSSASPICLMSRAKSTKSWLWHQRLSHLNFDTINELAKDNLVTIERRNHTLVEDARTMQKFSCAPLFLWAEAITTVCYTQNRSIIHKRFNKTQYELINEKKPDISFLHVFGALCYPMNDHEDIGKLGAKDDICFFLGYSYTSCAYRVYNQRTEKIMEMISVTFDELSAMDFEQRSGQPSDATRTAPAAPATQNLPTPNASITIAKSALTPTNSSTEVPDTPNTLQDVEELQQQQHVQQQDDQSKLQSKAVADNGNNAMFDENMFINPFAPPSTSSAKSSSQACKRNFKGIPKSTRFQDLRRHKK